MILKIKDTTIQFDDKELDSARELVFRFLNNVKEIETAAPSYWFTLLIQMHIISQEMINDYDTETIKRIVERLGVDYVD